MSLINIAALLLALFVLAKIRARQGEDEPVREEGFTEPVGETEIVEIAETLWQFYANGYKPRFDKNSVYLFGSQDTFMLTIEGVENVSDKFRPPQKSRSDKPEYYQYEYEQ